MSYDVFSQFYDLLIEDAEYEKRAKYYRGLFSSRGVTGGILLDLGCGTGKMSLEMAKAGFDVIGTDASVGMLNAAKRRALDAGADILFLNQRAEELDLYGTVDCAVCALDVLNHLESAESVGRVFERTSLFMNAGGAFVFDVNTVYKHSRVLADNVFVLEKENLFCVWRNEYEKTDRSVDITLDFFEKKGGFYCRSGEEFTERAYGLNLIKRLLEQTGFNVVGAYDDATAGPVNPKSERAVFLAEKK